MVTPGDVDTLAGDTLDSATQQAVDGLKRAVEEGRELHDLRRLLVAAGLNALATLIYLLVVRGCIVANRRLGITLSSAVQTRIERLKVAGVTAMQPAHFRSLTQRLVALSAWAAGLVATYLWLTFSFERFPYTRPWGEQLTGFLLSIVAKIAGSILWPSPGWIVVITSSSRASCARACVLRPRGGRQIRLGWLDSDTVKPTSRIVTASCGCCSRPGLSLPARVRQRSIQRSVGAGRPDDLDRRVEPGRASGKRHDPDVHARSGSASTREDRRQRRHGFRDGDVRHTAGHREGPRNWCYQYL
jgi:hypothetical protein